MAFSIGNKNEKLMKTEGLTIYGLALGMWELFGESSFATCPTIGEILMMDLASQSGIDIDGQSPEHILSEVTRLLIQDGGLFTSAKGTVDGNKLVFSCQNCSYSEGTASLEEMGVQPFYCPAYNIIVTAMNLGRGTRSQFVSRKWEESSQTCTMELKLIEPIQ
jgi:hypothetical protein